VNHQFICAAAALALFATPTLAEETTHRQAGAHVHGKGTLNIAIEGAKLEIELEAPGADIVGFETVAKGDQQKATLDKAKTQLADALKLFGLPAAAGCKLEKATVETHADDHDHNEKGEADHKGGDHDHDHEKTDGPQHSEFHATYALECSAPERLTGLSTTYFTTFPGAQSLSVNVATTKGQTQTELTRDKPTLDLTGMM